MSHPITAVILAAGKGTRMKSAKAKVLHQVFFRPMLHWVLDTVTQAGIERCAVVLGHQRAKVEAILDAPHLTIVLQEEQLGTGHAVLCAESACDSDLVLILCGDTPLIQAETLQAMIQTHLEQNATLSLMTTRLEEPFGYGRIVCDQDGSPLRIVEEKDASPQERAIREINAGIYLVDRRFLFTMLKQVGTDNAQGEVYLTDIVALAQTHNQTVCAFRHGQPIDVLGVNSRVELAQAHQVLQMRANQSLMLGGVTLYQPQTIAVAPGCQIGQDTIIEPGCQLTAGCQIGNDCLIGSHSVLTACHIGAGAVIGAGSVLSNCRIDANEHVPPLTHRVS